MNYERLYKLAQAEATRQTDREYPDMFIAGSALPRTDRQNRYKQLVVQKYLSFISPIAIGEAH